MKLKKIASLMLAGIMAVSMLTACGGNTVDNKDDGDDNTTTVPASNASTVFEGALSTKANIKIDMADNATLNANLNTAMENVTSSTIKLFNTVNKGVLNFATDSFGWVEEGGDIINAIDVIMAGDLKIVADEMGADSLVPGAFAALRPTFNEAEDETVTMLFAVDSAVSDDAAVKQVAKRLDGAISLLQIDDDVIDPSVEEAAPKAAVTVNPGLDWTTLHYEYSGSVSVASKVLTENHGMGMRIVAVQITRTAVA